MHFYSYLWLREDGTPYYAGKGIGRRAFFSFGHGAIKCPSDPSRILVFPMLNESEAFESEIALIGLFGRKDTGTGCLRNKTFGGNAPPSRKGIPHSEETKERMRKASPKKRKARSAETIQKLRIAGLRRRHPVEVKAKISESNRKRWANTPICVRIQQGKKMKEGQHARKR